MKTKNMLCNIPSTKKTNLNLHASAKQFEENKSIMFVGITNQAEVPDGSKYVQTVPDGKYLCPDRPRRKLPIVRLSCVHVQNFVRSPDFRAFMSRLSCVHVQNFVRSPDFRAFTRLSCVHVQTFVRSCPDFRAFDRLLCVHVQTFVRFLMFPDYVILNARRPPRAFIFGLDILASVRALCVSS